MLRALFIAGLCSIACAGESYEGSATTEDRCGWAVTWLVSMDEEAGDCEWSLHSLDTSVATVRSFHGEPSEEVPVCGLTTYERVDGLRPREVAEIWSPGDIDPDIAWLAVEKGRCR